MRFEAKYIGAQPGRQSIAEIREGLNELNTKLARVLNNIDSGNLSAEYAAATVTRKEYDKLSQTVAELSTATALLNAQVREINNAIAALQGG